MNDITITCSEPRSPPAAYEIAQQVDPTSRVVYIDNDPIVLAHDGAGALPAADGHIDDGSGPGA